MSRNLGKNLLEMFLVSLKLGLTSFGGPIAHIGYFHEEYVNRRKWLDERSYSDLVALCQLLPGPASSQVGIGIGVMRAGVWGGLIAWLGFTLPSVLALVLFALFLQHSTIGIAESGWIHGLKLVAVAIVAQAVLGMGQKLANDRFRASLAIGAAAGSLILPTPITQVLLLALAAVIGMMYGKQSPATSEESALGLDAGISRRTAIGSLIVFTVLLIGLPVLRAFSYNEWIALFDSFYRSGALVFGGGHVVLPLLERELIPAGWVDREQFLAGYGAAQAVPGPLFTFGSYLGAIAKGIPGAVTATIAIFLPAFLLVIGTLPFWNKLRRLPLMQGALGGVNAAVVGLLLAALYDPIWTSSVQSSLDFALAALLFLLLVFWKLPPWIIVISGAVAGAVLL
jgi:chromate transporter